MIILRTGRPFAALGAAAAVLGLACSEPDQPAAITVAPATVTLDAIGATQTLAATVTDAKGKTLTGTALTWASSSAAASVDQSGVVTAVAKGSADITASAGTVSGTAKVTVGQTISKVEAISGAQQTGPVGQALSQQVVVRVRDRLDQGVSGAAVTFTVSLGGGAVAPATGTTGADGQLAATWTLGITTGSFQVEASVAGSGTTALFTAKATPGPANNLAAVSGNNQFGYHDDRLAQLIAVRIRDQYGNGVPSYAVQFTTDPGNGTADSAIAFSDSAGVARSGWVMPSVPDTVTLQARALSGSGVPLLGSPVTFTAISHNLKVISVSPTTLVESQSATLSGTGFDPGNTQNVVSIDGVAASVTAASGSDLTVTVPAYDCKPSRAVTVQVTVGGIPATPVSRQLTPATPTLNLPVGQQAILTDPTQFCFQFPAAGGQEAYLIGVQSTSEVVSSLTPITLVGTAGAASAAPPALAPSFRPQAGALSPRLVERLERWRRHGEAELRRRESDRLAFETLRSAGQRAPRQTLAALVDSTVAPGDTVKGIRVHGSGSCTNYSEITTVVRAKGTKAIFLEDVANPTGGFTASNFTTFSQTFDTKIFPVLVAEFGAPADADQNGRLVIVVTKEVNKFGGGELGFVTSCDLFPRDGSDPASNGGEFTYVVSPDPNGTVSANFKYSLQHASQDFPDLIAHEPVHIIQFTRRMAASGGFLTGWLAEGQAVLGQEVVGDTIEGHTTGQNTLGFKEATNLDDTLSTDFYGLPFYALSLYFGWDPVSQPGIHKHLTTAPWECSWLDENSGPCVAGLELYGAPWALLRHVSDRFGNGNPGEASLQKAIIDNTLNGYALLQALTGVRIDTLLAQFAAMLFVDDSVLSAAPQLKMTSWNLHDVFYGSFAGFSLRTQLRLTPASVAFATFAKSANVRAASTYYAVISGGNRPATAVKARDGGGGILPSIMRYWIVRIQ